MLISVMSCTSVIVVSILLIIYVWSKYILYDAQLVRDLGVDVDPLL
jgi:hypothetical protein